MSKPRYALLAGEIAKNLGVIGQQNFDDAPGKNKTLIGSVEETFAQVRYLERRYDCNWLSVMKRLGTILEAVVTKSGASAFLGKQKEMLSPIGIAAVAGAIHRTCHTSSPSGVRESKKLTRLLVERIDSKEGVQEVYMLFRFGYNGSGSRRNRMQNFSGISEQFPSHRPIRDLPDGFARLFSPALIDAEQKLLTAGLLTTQIVVA